MKKTLLVLSLMLLRALALSACGSQAIENADRTRC
jgi:predicted small secreted protein